MYKAGKLQIQQGLDQNKSEGRLRCDYKLRLYFKMAKDVTKYSWKRGLLSTDKEVLLYKLSLICEVNDS